jgi:hypothetical protein
VCLPHVYTGKVCTYAVGLPNNTSSAGSGAKGNVNLPGTGQSVVSGWNPLLPSAYALQNIYTF